MFIVHVHDLPDHPLSRPLDFRLGPFVDRAQAETMAARAVETQEGTTAEVIETEDATHDPAWPHGGT